MPMDQGFSAYEVDSWCEAIDQLSRLRHAPRVFPGARWNTRSGGRSSRWGFLGAPHPVLQMMSRAVESGYAFALRDIREGSYDREIVQWRPALGRTRQ